jgi:hypothetical protein
LSRRARLWRRWDAAKKIFFAAPTSRKAPKTTGVLPALFMNERVAVRSSNRNSLPPE